MWPDSEHGEAGGASGSFFPGVFSTEWASGQVVRWLRENVLLQDRAPPALRVDLKRPVCFLPPRDVLILR